MTAGTAWDSVSAPAHPLTRVRLAPPMRTPLWWRDAVGSLTWASVLVTVALWVQHHGVQSLFSLDSGVTSLGRIAGLISADLLLIQVLLMARVPMIERSFGQDDLARRHRLVGFTSFNLLIAHLILITVGYGLSAHVNPVSQFIDLVLHYPGMLLAFAASALMVLVVVTSIKIARKKLRYESWHLLHLYAYLGVGLSIPHEVWTGTEFVSSPVATLYWWSLYVAAAGSVLIWRVGLPLWRSLRHGLTVQRVVQEAPGIVSVHVGGRNLHRLRASAGQFFTWRFMDGPGWTRGNPYSLSAAPTDGSLRITVKDLGDGSGRLAQLKPGAKVLVEGPYGKLHAGVRTRRRVTLLASGIGITPMRALMEEIEYRRGELTLIYRASTESEMVFRHEIDAIAARTGARVYYVLGRRAPGRDTWLPQAAAHLTDSQALRELVPDIDQHDVYVCGADGWMDAARDAALGAGVPEEHVHLERFSW
jgi:ferredoxin-NADP reductase/DMSO/TMAO reductase YedYZ heme-binding membrane subunit